MINENTPKAEKKAAVGDRPLATRQGGVRNPTTEQEMSVEQRKE